MGASLRDRAFAAMPSSQSSLSGPFGLQSHCAVHFSTGNADWSTPQAFFDQLAARFGAFGLDPCATAENAKCARFFTAAEDGLKQEWRGRVFVNPPYGRSIGKWIRKAYESARAGALVVCLVPARTDTAWWHDYVVKGEVEFIRGRLKFGNRNKDAPFASALVIFRPAIADRNGNRHDNEDWRGPQDESGGAKQSPESPSR